MRNTHTHINIYIERNKETERETEKSWPAGVVKSVAHSNYKEIY